MKTLLIILLQAPFITFSFTSNYSDSLLSKASSIGGTKGVEFMLDNFYSVYSKSNEEGIEWAELAHTYSSDLNNDQLIGRSDLCLGVAWYLRGDYENSINHFQNALKTFEELGDHQYIGRTCNELSVYTRKQKQYEKALGYLDRSFSECTLCGDVECVETSLNNRGVIYEMMGEYELAIKFYHEAEKIALENDNQIGLSYIYNNLGEVYRLLELYDSTYSYIMKSSDIRGDLGDVQGVAMNWANLGEMYFLSGNNLNAKNWLVKAANLSNDIGYPDLEGHCYRLLFKVESKMGDIDSSLYYLNKSDALKDSILNIEKIRSLSEMEIKFETEKAEKTAVEEKKKRIVSELKVANRNNWILGLSGGSLSLIFLLLFLNQRKRKKAQEEKNFAVLKEKEKGLEAVFDATESERQRIAKDLHDGIGQQLSGLKLAWENLSLSIKGERAEEASKLIELTEILNDTAAEVREISHKMMPKVLDEYGLISGISEMLEKSLKLTSLKYDFEHFNIDGRFDARIEISLYRITQELVNNVIKHSGATVLSVQLFKNKNQLILIIEDNGKGFDINEEKGHGLLNITSRLNTIHGEVNYEASSQRGTIATIRVNLD